jgi:hypothetical protein
MCVDEHAEQKTTEDKRDLCVEEYAENRGQLMTNEIQTTT